jgi:hypothetical protein
MRSHFSLTYISSLPPRARSSKSHCRSLLPKVVPAQLIVTSTQPRSFYSRATLCKLHKNNKNFENRSVTPILPLSPPALIIPLHLFHHYHSNIPPLPLAGKTAPVSQSVPKVWDPWSSARVNATLATAGKAQNPCNYHARPNNLPGKNALQMTPVWGSWRQSRLPAVRGSKQQQQRSSSSSGSSSSNKPLEKN